MSGRAPLALAAWTALFGCAEPEPGVVCTSGRTVGTSEGEDMAPGQICNDCHAYTNSGGDGQQAPIFAFAGTVYRTAHEPDDCAGGALDGIRERPQIVVVSASGRRYVTDTSKGGNFMLELRPTAPRIEFPVTAQIRYRGKTRWMIEPVMTGECNSCHTVDGKDGAPGRIRVP